MGIRLEATFPALPREVYDILADAGRLSALSGTSGTAGRAAGEQFAAFDGHVTGRQVELIPSTIIVQAWRFPVWAPGTYTLVRFTLTAGPRTGAGGTADAEATTCLTIEQHGYPDEADALGCHESWHQHLEDGWPMFYLSPLARHFASQAASARAAAGQEIESLAQAQHA
jgi:uncharacterized protein YndB with AHSA1/START domain